MPVSAESDGVSLLQLGVAVYRLTLKLSEVVL